MAAYSCLIVKTRTGQVLGELPVTKRDWSDSIDLSRPGAMTVTVPLVGDDGRLDATVRNTARSVAAGKWFLSLCLVRDGRALWAGPVVTHSRGPGARSVSFGCTSIAKILDARRVLAAGHELTPTDPGADVELALSQTAIPVALIQLATTGYGRELPLQLPAITATEDITRTYKAADLASVSERLVQATQETGGPDVSFRPVLNLGQTLLVWQVDVGTPRLGTVASEWVWDLPTTVTGIGEDGDASEQVFRGYVPGDGAGVDDSRPIGVFEDTTLVDQGWPMLERENRDNTSLREQVLLDRQATSYVRSGAQEARTWSISVDAEAWPEIGLWRFGDNALFHVRGDLWIPDGDYLRRLVGVSHRDTRAELETTEPLAVSA